jgi:hypothetical protein
VKDQGDIEMRERRKRGIGGVRGGFGRGSQKRYM